MTSFAKKIIILLIILLGNDTENIRFNYKFNKLGQRRSSPSIKLQIMGKMETNDTYNDERYLFFAR